jgi:hypothetical protein
MVGAQRFLLLTDFSMLPAPRTKVLNQLISLAMRLIGEVP